MDRLLATEKGSLARVLEEIRNGIQSADNMWKHFGTLAKINLGDHKTVPK